MGDYFTITPRGVGIGSLHFPNISKECNGTVHQCRATLQDGGMEDGPNILIICEGQTAWDIMSSLDMIEQILKLQKHKFRYH